VLKILTKLTSGSASLSTQTSMVDGVSTTR